MKKQYRAEIRQHVQAGRKVEWDFNRAIRDNLKEITRHERAIAQLTRKDSTLARRRIKATAKIANRIAILEGRLS